MKYLKKRLSRVSSLSLFSVLMMTLHAEARLPIIAFKNVTRHFKKGQEFNSPVFGEAALYAGVAYDLRLYGNIEPGVKDGKRFYIGDKGRDAISRLTKELLPSPTGALNVETTALDNFGRYVQSPKTVAVLLNFAHQIRKGDTFNDTQISTYSDTLLKTCPGVDAKDYKNLRTKVNGILRSIRESILEESKSPYPKYTTEQVINAFFCEKFSTQADIWTLLRELDDDMVDKANIPKDEDLLTSKDLEVIARKEVFDADDVFALANADVFGPIIPYKPGNLISNGNARAYDRKKDQYRMEKIFADCAEKAATHVVNLVLFNPVTQEFDLSHVRKHKKEGNLYFKNLDEFYVQQTPVLANGGDIYTRSLGARVTGDLNTENDPTKIRYLKDTYELDPGYINFVRAYQKVIGLELKALSPDASLETQKEWLEESLTTLFQALNPTRTYDFELSTLKQDRGDLSGKLEIIVKDNNNEKLFSFEYHSIVGVHSEIKNLKILTEQIDAQDYSEALKTHTTVLEEKTAEDAVWLMTSKVKKSLAPLYGLFTQSLSDNDSRIEALKTIHSYFAQGTLTSVLPQLLKNILDDISWEDKAVLSKVSLIVAQLTKIKELQSILLDKVKGFDLSRDSDLQGPEFLSLAKGIKTLQANKDFGDLIGLERCEALQNLYVGQGIRSTLKLENIPNLQLIDASSSISLKEVFLSNMPNLKLLNLGETDELETISVNNLKGLKHLGLKGSGIKTLYGLKGLTNLESLDLENTTNLKKLSVDNWRHLKGLNLTGSAIEAINGLDTLTNLEKLYAGYTKNLDELSVENLSNLKTLDLEHSSINTLRGVNTLVKLEKLDLSYTHNLKKVSLENLHQLKSLEISESSIQTLKGLNAPNLYDLSLDCANLKSLEITGEMKQLKLDLRGSGITSRAQIKGIEHLDESKIVWVD
jgi:hypothetical protein